MAVALIRKLDIGRQLGFGPLIAEVLRFQLDEYCVDVGGGEHVASDEAGQVILRRAGVEAESKALRVDSADPQGGDIAHCAYGKREVEADEAGVGRRRCRPLYLREAAVPARGVVVFGVEALERRLFENLDHRDTLRRHAVVANPCGRIGLVELPDVVPIICKVRPTQAGGRTATNQAPTPPLPLGRENRGVSLRTGRLSASPLLPRPPA